MNKDPLTPLLARGRYGYKRTIVMVIPALQLSGLYLAVSFCIVSQPLTLTAVSAKCHASILCAAARVWGDYQHDSYYSYLPFFIALTKMETLTIKILPFFFNFF